MSGRAGVVLSRFPAHLDATRPGKQLGIVAESVSVGLDDLSASLASIRRAHRLGHADATTDIQLHGGLHRLGLDAFAAIDARIDGIKTTTAALETAITGGDAAARDAAVAALCAMLAVGVPAGSPADAAAALVLAAKSLTDYEGRRETYRARVRAESFIHSRGNGTIAALLEAAASSLDLVIDDDTAIAFKEGLRPVVTVTNAGTPGASTCSYIVVARSLSKNVDRLSAIASTTTGAATLSATDNNVLAWELPPDARDFLVFRTLNGANPANVGLLTPTALDATTTSFADTGMAATPGMPDPETDDALFHSMDRFWHAAFVHERAPAGDSSGDEIIGMEENPVRRDLSPPDPPDGPGPAPRVNAELFVVYRRGFGRSLLQAHVVGIGDRTIGPMLVNRNEGIGIGFAGKVPDGSLLVFDETGHVTLDGTDVTPNAFSWQGAVFAGDPDDPAAPYDFVFDGPGVGVDRRAVFAVAKPFDALDGAFAFPSAGDPIDVTGIEIGTTHFAFFVQEAHFSNLDDSVDPNVIVPISPRTHLGFLDDSVFAPPPDGEVSPAAKVQLSWLEHEAYALRILIPRRFSAFDADGKPPMTDLVRRALERHRAAGIDIAVEYIDDRWILGASDVTAGSSPDPILSLRGGSVLWDAPA